MSDATKRTTARILQAVHGLPELRAGLLGEAHKHVHEQGHFGRRSHCAHQRRRCRHDDRASSRAAFPRLCMRRSRSAIVETGAPRDLTLIMCAGAGDSKGLGTGRLHHDGLLKRVIAANFGRMPKVAAGGASQQDPGLQSAPRRHLEALSHLRLGQPGSLLEGRPAHLRRSAPWRRQGQHGDQGRPRQAGRGRGQGVAVLQGDADQRRADPRHERRSGSAISAWRRSA